MLCPAWLQGSLSGSAGRGSVEARNPLRLPRWRLRRGDPSLAVGGCSRISLPIVREASPSLAARDGFADRIGWRFA